MKNDAQLEDLLEKKGYTDEAKSLLLNIVYKIETAYNDFKTVKPNSKSKSEIMADIMESISNRCDSIEVMAPEESDGKIYVSREKKLIRTFPSDNDLLQAIYYIKTPYSKRISNVFEKSVLVSLEKGMAINGVEVIRDFNGWSWNNSLDNSIDQYYNLIYQDLVMLIGEAELENILRNSDIIENILKRLKRLYGEENARAVVLKLIKACTTIYMDNELENEQEVFDYLENRKQKLYEISNKSEYISKLSKQNKHYTELVGKIDSIISSQTLLNKKYELRNVSGNYDNIESYKIYLISHKDKMLKLIEDNKNAINPFEYVKQKNLIQEEIHNLEEIKECYNDDAVIYKSTIELQKAVIECLYKKIEVYDLKKELINLIYEVRYYNQIPLEGIKLVKHKELRREIERMQETLIEKLKQNKVVETFSEYSRINNYVIKGMFITKAMNINKVIFKYSVVDGGIDIEFSDGEGTEYQQKLILSEEELNGFTKKENKKMKIII